MQRQLLQKTAERTLLDPFNAFVHRGLLCKAVENGRLDRWKVSIKDNIAVQNWPLTCASKALQSFISPYSADVVESLLSGGAEIVGKTNMDEFGMG